MSGKRSDKDAFQAAIPAIMAWNMFHNQRVQQETMAQHQPSTRGQASTQESKEVIVMKLKQLDEDRRALQELHIKSAEAAMRRSSELKQRIEELEEQSRRDRQMMMELCEMLPAITDVSMPDQDEST